MLKPIEISLRNLQESDADVILKWENDTAIWEASETAQPFSRQDILQFVREPQEISYKNQLRLMICTADEKPVGCIDLFEYNAEKQKAGVGVLIAEESDRNMGYATAALNQLKSFARNELQIVHLFCNIQPNNQSSIRLFEKCGFQFMEVKQLNGSEVHYFEYSC